MTRASGFRHVYYFHLSIETPGSPLLAHTPERSGVNHFSFIREEAMSFKIDACNHEDWQRHELAQFADFADKVSRRNMGPDFGDWFFAAERPDRHDAVLYYGSWDAEHPAGDPAHTHAMIFDITDPDEAVEYTHRVMDWESKPECDDQPDSNDEF